MNKQVLQTLLQQASEQFVNAPYYVVSGTAKYLRLQTENEQWLIKPDKIILNDDNVVLSLFKTRGFEVPSVQEFLVTLPYTTILTVVTVVYKDSNEYGSYTATIIKVPDSAIPTLLPY